MKKSKKLRYFLTATALLLVVNQIIKIFSIYNFAIGNTFKNAVFSLSHVRNTGAAFSILEGSQGLLIAVSIVALIFIGKFVYQNIEKLPTYDFMGLCFMTGGIIGNLSERILDGFVTDYIKLEFIDFPIFNISDIFINIGAILLIFSILVSSKAARND